MTPGVWPVWTPVCVGGGGGGGGLDWQDLCRESPNTAIY